MRRVSEAIEAVTVMPAAVQNKATLACLKRSIRTHGRRLQLLVVLNNSLSPWREYARSYAEERGAWVIETQEQFNLNRCHLLGQKAAEILGCEHLVVCNSDVYFHPGWDGIIARWKMNPHLDSALSVHAAIVNRGHDAHQNYLSAHGPRKGHTPVDAPLMHVWAIRTKDCDFDLQFDFWNTDCDHWLRAKKLGRPLVVDWETRAGHTGEFYKATLDYRAPVRSVSESNRRMREKYPRLYMG